MILFSRKPGLEQDFRTPGMELLSVFVGAAEVKPDPGVPLSFVMGAGLLGPADASQAAGFLTCAFLPHVCQKNGVTFLTQAGLTGFGVRHDPAALLYCLPVFHIAPNLDLLKSTANLSLFYIQMSAEKPREKLSHTRT